MASKRLPMYTQIYGGGGTKQKEPEVPEEEQEQQTPTPENTQQTGAGGNGGQAGEQSTPSQGGSVQTPAQTVQDSTRFQYDPAANTAYTQAMAALQKAQDSMPIYAGTYDQQLQDLYSQIVGREKFSYDLNADALFQQYKDQYVTQGKLAMMDTMGQAAAMTGGYGSSYAQGVGQQQYQAYLQKLNEVAPELYGMAWDRYNQEGQNLLNQYAMLGDMADTEYGKYQDALSQYWQNLSFQKQQADDAYDRGYNEWYNALQMAKAADDTAYSRQQDAYDKMVGLMTSVGYTPSSQELAAAGMNDAQAQAFLDYYKQQNTPKNSTDPAAAVDDPSLSWDQYHEVRETAAAAYEKYGEAGLAGYINDMVNDYGLPEDTAESIYNAIISAAVK